MKASPPSPWRVLDAHETPQLVLDTEGCIIYANRKLCRLLDVAADRLRGQPWYEVIVAPAAKAEAEADFRQLCRARRARTLHYPLRVGAQSMQAWCWSRISGRLGLPGTFLLAACPAAAPSTSGVQALADGGGDMQEGLSIPDIEGVQIRKQLEQAKLLLKGALTGTVEAIARAEEARDPYTAGHQRRVAQLSVAIARQMGLDEERMEGIHLGAMIHDIGKIQVPTELLSKPTSLSPFEYAIVQQHAATGFEILKDIPFPWPIAQIAYQHHERMDGSGYPQGLRGDDILIESRVVAVADVVEAMGYHRPYRPAKGMELALTELRMNRGQRYDEAAADACLQLFAEHRFSFTA